MPDADENFTRESCLELSDRTNWQRLFLGWKNGGFAKGEGRISSDERRTKHELLKANHGCARIDTDADMDFNAEPRRDAEGAERGKLNR